MRSRSARNHPLACWISWTHLRVFGLRAIRRHVIHSTEVSLTCRKVAFRRRQWHQIDDSWLSIFSRRTPSKISVTTGWIIWRQDKPTLAIMWTLDEIFAAIHRQSKRRECSAHLSLLRCNRLFKLAHFSMLVCRVKWDKHAPIFVRIELKSLVRIHRHELGETEQLSSVVRTGNWLLYWISPGETGRVPDELSSDKERLIIHRNLCFNK